MKTVLDPQQMKAVERIAIQEIGIPSLVLMERAAYACAMELKARFPGKPSVLVCGTGNNGADGLALARILKLWDWQTTFYVVGEQGRATEEWALQYGLCKKLNVPEVQKTEDADIIVDAIFGIGLSRSLSGQFLDAVRVMNAKTGFKLAVDVPSGIACSTGAVMGEAFLADLTVTFQFEKAGQLLYPGRAYCGELVCADIGIPARFNGLLPAMRFEPKDLAELKDRPQNSNKGTFGRVLVVAGSANMCGAAYLSSLAAYRTGAGLVEVFTPWENRVPLQETLPEAILNCYDTENYDETQLIHAMERADSVVLGPGLSTREYAAALVQTVLSNCSKPLIIDADAINIIAAHPSMLSGLPQNVILTPHVKEFSRLTGMTVDQIKADPISAAGSFSKVHNVVLVLKDAATVIADPEGHLCINTSGCSGMATGGSGDVLAGLIGARCAYNKTDMFQNAALCVYLHGLAGQAAAEDKGENAMLASDIAHGIGTVLCRI